MIIQNKNKQIINWIILDRINKIKNIMKIHSITISERIKNFKIYSLLESLSVVLITIQKLLNAF